MKAMVITPKSQTEFRFINDLLKKLGISASPMTEEELEVVEEEVEQEVIAPTRKALAKPVVVRPVAKVAVQPVKKVVVVAQPVRKVVPLKR